MEFSGIPLNTKLHSLGVQCNIEILGCHSVRLNLEKLLSIPMNQENISISITWIKVEYNLILYFFEFTGIPLNTTLHSLGIQCNIEILGCHSVRLNLEELLSIPMHQEYISISITWNKVLSIPMNHKSIVYFYFNNME